MITRIHVNQHVIRANRKTGARDAPLTVKAGKRNTKGSTVYLYDDEGSVVAKVVYRPDKPLSCGATVWVETEYHVDTTGEFTQEVYTGVE